MNKGELVDKIANSAGITKAAANSALDAFTAVIAEAMKENKEVVLMGFGRFKVSERKERSGRNPRTGEKINIAASRSVRFIPGKILKDAVNNGGASV